MSKSVLIKSSLAKKYWMAGTGLFLCLFLVGHLLGNLQLLLPSETASDSFNLYAQFMTTNPVVKILSYITYFSILFHAIDGILLVVQNKKARPVQYAYNKPSANSNWASRNMGLLGTVLLLFLIIHMRSFWYEMHFGEVPKVLIDGENVKDLYSITKDSSYYYSGGWQIKGVYSLIIGFIFSASTIWNTNLMFLQSYAWIIGAFVSLITYYLLAKK